MTAPETARRPRGRARGLARVAALSCLLGATAAPAAAPAATPFDPSAQPCFGAAARDPLAPCSNPKLKLTVFPTVEDAVLEPNSPCAAFSFIAGLSVCNFGAPPTTASAKVALIGDSHASHWRAAMDVVLAGQNWAGVSITRSSCPLTKAVTVLPEPTMKQCRQWKPRVYAYLKRHPEIHTVFVGQHRAGVEVPRGSSAFRETERGYIAGWKALPPSVRHVVVIRDVPRAGIRTLGCVVDAVGRRRQPGPACALARKRALPVDPAAAAAHKLDSPRVQVLDLTSFMCSERYCLPVIGGALTHKDNNHITRVFARSLGPYFLRGVRTLMAAWPLGDQVPPLPPTGAVAAP